MLENIGKTIIVTGLIVGYSYLVEHFIAWYGGGKAEEAQYMWRMTGYYSWCFWLMIVCNAVVPIASVLQENQDQHTGPVLHRRTGAHRNVVRAAGDYRGVGGP